MIAAIFLTWLHIYPLVSANQTKIDTDTSFRKELVLGCATKISSECPFSGNNDSISSMENNPFHCLRVNGFSDRDFNANGIFCKCGKNDQYNSVAASNHLRYEFRPVENSRWELLRVIKTMNESWVGIPIYVGLLKERNDYSKTSNKSHSRTMNPDDFEWLGLSFDPSVANRTKIDFTEPVLNISTVNVTTSYELIISTLQRFRSNQIGFCEASNCDRSDAHFVGRNFTNNTERCSEYWKIAAQLSEVTGNHIETSSRLEKARSCAIEEIHSLALAKIPIPRYNRWEVAELSYLMTWSFAKAGSFYAALDAALVGLANSPEQKQRRKLYVNLGDLRLATGEGYGGYHAYLHALRSVKEKGGSIEKQHFLRYWQNSVGAFITKVVAGSYNEEEEAFSGLDIIPTNYGFIRKNMLLHIDNERELEILAKSLKKNPHYPLTNLGGACKMNKTDGIISESKPTNKPKFCSHFFVSS